MKFKVGDKVRIVRYLDYDSHENFCHRLIGTATSIQSIDIDGDGGERFCYVCDCDTGTTFSDDELEFISTNDNQNVTMAIAEFDTSFAISPYFWGWDWTGTNNNNNKMNKLTSMLKRLLDADSQVLYKIGFLDSNLNLTEKGKQELMLLIFDDYKAKLVVKAKEQISEIEKEE